MKTIIKKFHYSCRANWVGLGEKDSDLPWVFFYLFEKIEKKKLTSITPTFLIDSHVKWAKAYTIRETSNNCLTGQSLLTMSSCKPIKSFKVMLHGTIPNDDF